MTVSWFSAGVSSAVATKLMINEIDEIIYTHIDNQHEDSLRFISDCEKWFGRKITIMQSPLKSVGNAIRQSAFINCPGGASCTRLLKRRVRAEWERDKKELIYVWGMDIKEKKRCIDLEEAMPDMQHRFPLVDKQISKAQAHEMLKRAGIKRPKMYDLGYNNNNCIGCVKGSKGYWNKIRVDFPDAFDEMVALERLIGHSCMNGTFLDELKKGTGFEPVEIDDDCGIFCELKEYQL